MSTLYEDVTPVAPLRAERGREASGAALRLDIVSDAICPWCLIGKRRLEKALALLPPDGPAVAVRWLPFQLNPDMPKAGLDRRDYRTRKFGSWERSQVLDAQVAAAGREEGLDFRFDLMARTPNTVDAHRLVWLAGREGGDAQDAVVEGLFRAYFTEGRDIGDPTVLADIGAAAGLDRPVVSAMLEGGEGAAEVAAEEAAARRLGLQGVPTFVLDGRPLFSGAQAPELIAAALTHAAAAAAPRA